MSDESRTALVMIGGSCWFWAGALGGMFGAGWYVTPITTVLVLSGVVSFALATEERRAA